MACFWVPDLCIRIEVAALSASIVTFVCKHCQLCLQTLSALSAAWLWYTPASVGGLSVSLLDMP